MRWNGTHPGGRDGTASARDRPQLSHAIDRGHTCSAPIVAPFVIVARWLSSERVIASGFSEASAKGYVGTATVTANVWDGFLEEALELQNL
jgi:hypothetical protein